MKELEKESTSSCLLCQRNSFWQVYSNVRGDKSGGLAVVECDACGHRQLSHPVYDLKLYEQDLQVFSSIKECGTSFQQFTQDSWLQACRRVDRVVSDGLLPLNDSSIIKSLDVGGGYGFFSHLLKKKIPAVEVSVLDPSKGRIESGKNLIEEYDDAPCHNLYINALLDEKYASEHRTTYNLVTLWHVVEHVPDPINLVAYAWDLVKPGGWLSLEVPNADDELIERSSAFASYSYMIEHLSYFTPKTLGFLLKKSVGQNPISIYGYQRYGIFNYIHWIHANAPLGEDPDYFPGKDRWWLEKVWREKRENDLTTDALVLNIRKP